MKAIDLLDTIGQTHDTYLRDAMEAFSGTCPQVRRRPGARLSILVAVLVLAALLTTAAFASRDRLADWFPDFFGSLTSQEQEIIDSMEMEPAGTDPVSTTVNGTRVTIVRALGDAHNCYVLLRIEGPEGTDLSREDPTKYAIYNNEYIMDDTNVRLLSQTPTDGARYYAEAVWEDAVPGDNILEVTFRITLDNLTEMNFTDREPEQITIPGLWSGDEALLEGPWVLELNTLGGTTMELEVAGMTATHELNGAKNTVTLNAMTVSQLGIDVNATFAQPVSGEASFAFPTTTAVLMDGTCLDGTINPHGYGTELAGTLCKYKLYFNSLVELEQIDHIRFCGLVIPVCGDGDVEPASEIPEDYTLGTHVTLGDPNSLILSKEAVNPVGLTSYASHMDGIFAYAEYTEEGIRFYETVSSYNGGRLAITVTGSRIVTDLADLGGSYAGFSPDVYSMLVELEEPDPEQPNKTTEFIFLDHPVGINDDGSFQEGYYLILVDLIVENQGVEQDPDTLSPNNNSIYGFNTAGFLFLSLLEDKTSGYPYMNSQYFSDADFSTPWVNYFEILPGETKEIHVGFYMTPERDWGTTLVRGTNTCGNENGIFIDLDLDP